MWAPDKRVADPWWKPVMEVWALGPGLLCFLRSSDSSAGLGRIPTSGTSEQGWNPK